MLHANLGKAALTLKNILNGYQTQRRLVDETVWKSFRELTDQVWTKAFRDKIFEETNSKKFNYIIAVTKLNNSKRINEFSNK